MNNPIRQLKYEEYPRGLSEIPEPPETLYVRGTLFPLHNKILTVVGSRALSQYGAQACRTLISGLSGYPITIVSGLALGADSCAHESALNAGLHAVGVPGSGISDKDIAPRSSLALAHKILDAGGALLTEFPEDYRVAKYSFPKRNRIMVGISDAVLLIEAGEKSGTGITARLAMDYNRDLLCVPHRIGDVHGYGSHYFIKHGAALVTSSADILEALHLEVTSSAERTASLLLSEHEQIVYNWLEEPLSKDELLRSLKLSTSDALATLAALELRGVITEEYGLYRRT